VPSGSPLYRLCLLLLVALIATLKLPRIQRA
jgi:hypothetical protein